MLSWFFLLLCWWICHVLSAGNPDSLSEALAASSARLTCDISAAAAGDQPATITWYRLGDGRDTSPPIYTYDARQQQQAGGRWSDVTMGERIYMRIVSNEAQLTIDPVDASDEAQYKCQVEFRRAQPRIQFVNLTVVGKINFNNYYLRFITREPFACSCKFIDI